MNSAAWLNNLIDWCQKFEKIVEENPSLQLSQLAYQELSKIDWSLGFNHQEFIERLFSLPQFPKQVHVKSQFGEPPFTIYYSEKNNFYVEIYFWDKLHTSIHDHGFQGAYQVISGQSIQSEYEFIEEVKKNKDSSIGILNPKELTLLNAGDTREIILGNKFIHRVLHLEKKTASLIVRSAKNNYIQKTYIFKHISTTTWPEDKIILKLRTLNWMLQNEILPSKDLIGDLFYFADFWRTLLQYESSKKLFQKLSFMFFSKEQLEKIANETHFNLLLEQLQNVDDKILLTAYECLTENLWESWVSDNLSLTTEEAKNKLREGLAKTNEFQSNGLEHIPFLKDLF